MTIWSVIDTCQEPLSKDTVYEGYIYKHKIDLQMQYMNIRNIILNIYVLLC